MLSLFKAKLKPALPFDLQYAINEYGKSLAGPIKEFEQAVWFDTGLCRIIRESKKSGHSVKLGKWKLSLFCTAGRVMWQIEDKKGNWASFVNAEDEDVCRMGLHKRSMSDEEIRAALKEVAECCVGGMKEDPNLWIA